MLTVAAYLCLLVVGTLVEYVSIKEPQSRLVLWVLSLFPVKLLKCFSVISSTSALGNVRVGNDEQLILKDGHGKYKCNRGVYRLNMLDGLRFLTLVWVVFAHSSAYTHVTHLMKVLPFRHFPDGFLRMKNNNWFFVSYLENTYFAVSIFFMIRYSLDRTKFLLINRMLFISQWNTIVVSQ